MPPIAWPVAMVQGKLPQARPGDVVLALVTVVRLRHVPTYAWTEAVTERLRTALRATAGASNGSSAGQTPAVSPRAGDPAGAKSAGRRARSTPGVAGTNPAASGLNGQELSSLAWALAKLHHRAGPEFAAEFMEATQAVLDVQAAAAAAVAEEADGAKGGQPGRGRAAGVATAAGDVAWVLGDQLATLLWAVVDLGQVRRVLGEGGNSEGTAHKVSRAALCLAPRPGHAHFTTRAAC